MSWNQSAYTVVGAEMLTETLSGRKLTITQAFGGTEAADEGSLGNATDVQGDKITLGLMGIEDAEAEDSEGNLVPAKKVGIMITNEGRSETCYLHQVAVFGRLDGESEDRMIYILQDERGIEVPPEADNPDFEVDLYTVIFISNKAQITVNVTAGTRVTPGQVQQMIEAHNDSPTAHSGIIQQAMSQAVQQAVAQVSGMVGSAIVKEITIPAEGWALDETGSDEPYMGMDEYRYYVDVTDEEVTDDQVPIVALHKDALETAKQAGLCPTAQTVTGAVRFWARYEPMQDMAATLALLSASGSGQTGGGGTYVLPVATATTLGGVKLGEGFSTTPDGTLSYTGTGLPEDAFAQPDETQEMLDEVLPLA